MVFGFKEKDQNGLKDEIGKEQNKKLLERLKKRQMTQSKVMI